jgi:predicted nucleic-acid-binding Zn-ribbon protein
MKKSGKCPKCKSSDIQHLPKLVTGGGLSGGEALGASINVLGSTAKRFEGYICKNCGYTEIYMPEKDLH